MTPLIRFDPLQFEKHCPPSLPTADISITKLLTLLNFLQPFVPSYLSTPYFFFRPQSIYISWCDNQNVITIENKPMYSFIPFTTYFYSCQSDWYKILPWRSASFHRKFYDRTSFENVISICYCPSLIAFLNHLLATIYKKFVSCVLMTIKICKLNSACSSILIMKRT
jgi:hypothetical protein